MPDPELHYFAREYSRGDAWYLKQFEPQQGVDLIGEKSNSYLSDPQAVSRIHKALPEIKLISQLRNPVERAYSDYCMLYRWGDVGPEIEKHLDPNRGANERFLKDGVYAPQLQGFIDLYGQEALLILDFDTVKTDPAAQINALRQHLGFDTDLQAPLLTKKVKAKTATRIPPQMRKQLSWLKPMIKPFRNTKPFQLAWNALAQKPAYPALSPGLRRALHDYYRPSIAQLETITDGSFKHWV